MIELLNHLQGRKVQVVTSIVGFNPSYSGILTVYQKGSIIKIDPWDEEFKKTHPQWGCTPLPAYIRIDLIQIIFELDGKETEHKTEANNG